MGNVSLTPPFTEGQLRAFAIIPKVSASFSMVGSGFVIQQVLCGGKKKRLRRVYHRILLGMSSMDFLFGIKQFTGTWAVPEDDLRATYGAAGTVESCTFMGFLGQGSALASVYYSGFLTLFFFLVVRQGQVERRIGRVVEPWMHFLALSMGWGTAIAGLPLELYNSAGTGCWISESPPRCQESFRASEEASDRAIPCIRGDNAYIYRWVFFWAHMWLVFVLSAVAMFLIYRGIAQAERQSEPFTFEASARNFVENTSNNISNTRASFFGRGRSARESITNTTSPKNSQKFAAQAMLYCFFFLLTWIFQTFHWSFIHDKTYSPLLILTLIFMPLQGFFNALVYVRPRYLKYRQRQRQRQLMQQLGHIEEEQSPSAVTSRLAGLLLCGRSGGKESSSVSRPPESATGSANALNEASQVVDNDASAREEEDQHLEYLD